MKSEVLLGIDMYVCMYV